MHRLDPYRVTLVLALAAILAGAAAWLADDIVLAERIWAAGVVPTLALLTVEVARSLWRREAGVDLIALVAMGAALALGEALAGVVIATMLSGGNALEDFARRRATRELRALLGRAPTTAHRERAGRLEDIPIDAVGRDDVLLVKAGEIVPVDGTVEDDTAVLDEAALTGESLPVTRRSGERVRSGTVNVGGPFRLRAVGTAAESTYAAIVRLVQTAQADKAPFVRLADRYALVFLAVTATLAGAAWLLSGDPVRALAVLVVATPCPLILAAPVALIAGVSAAARRGVLIKGGGPLEALAQARTLVLDKTGTLTTGIARLSGIEPQPGWSADELLRLAAALDQTSQHVLAEAIVAAARARGLTLPLPEEALEEPGAGISGRVEGHRVRLGSLAYVDGVAPRAAWCAVGLNPDGQSRVFVSVDGQPAGILLLADEIRPDTPRALRALRRAGLDRIIMLSGDRHDVAETIAEAVGVDTVLAERSPQDKVDAVAAESAEAVTVMVGDGINDAPALAAATVGVAMGARGASAASEAADVVLLVDRLDRLADGIATARRARRIALESVLAGMALSGAAMIVAALGYLPPVAGALLQELIDVAVILNALRALGGGGREAPTLDPAEVRRLTEAHEALWPLLDRLRHLADGLGRIDDAVALRELRAVEGLVRTEILPHERADESRLHPRLAVMLGGRDPMAPISRTHREIAHLARRLTRLAATAEATGLGETLLPELRRALYALDAVLRLHFVQENEIYDSVAEDRAARPVGRPQAVGS